MFKAEFYSYRSTWARALICIQLQHLGYMYLELKREVNNKSTFITYVYYLYTFAQKYNNITNW